MSEDVNKPVVVWERGALRVVAVHAVDEDDGEDVRFLAVEYRVRDLTGGESWRVICTHDDAAAHAVDVLAAEIVSRNQIVPAWVRALVRDVLEDHDETGAAPDLGGAA